MRNQVLPLIKSLLPGLLILITTTWLWQLVFHHYILDHTYQSDIFRTGIRQAHLPFYLWDESPQKSHLWLIPGLIILIAWIYLKRTWVIILSPLFVFCTFALSESTLRLSGKTAHFQTFAEDLGKFENLPAIFSNWELLQPQLSIHNQHYPPGVFSLIYIFGNQATLWLTFLSLLGIFGILWRRANDAAARTFLVLPGVLIFSSIDPGGIYAFWGLLFFEVLHSKYSLPVKSIWAGLAIFICSLFSYMFLWILVITGLYFMVQREWHVLKLLGGVLLTFFVSYTLLFMLTGFSGPAVMLQSVKANMQLNGSSGWDDPMRWLLRSSENILQFCLSAGPLIWLIKPGNGKWSKILYILIPLAACSGLFFGETDRVWMPFLPFTALAISESECIQQFPKTLLTLSAGYALILELCFKNYI